MAVAQLADTIFPIGEHPEQGQILNLFGRVGADSHRMEGYKS
jgi:hypothetical protein